MGNVETAQIQFCQGGTGVEHAFHVFHFRCVEPADVNAVQTATVSKHRQHAGHLGSIQVLHAIYML